MKYQGQRSELKGCNMVNVTHLWEKMKKMTAKQIDNLRRRDAIAVLKMIKKEIKKYHFYEDKR